MRIFLSLFLCNYGNTNESLRKLETKKKQQQKTPNSLKLALLKRLNAKTTWNETLMTFLCNVVKVSKESNYLTRPVNVV